MISLIDTNWRLDNITAILFDKDGTIIDSHLYWGEIVKRRAKKIIELLKLDKSIFSELCLAFGYSVSKERLLPNGPVGIDDRDTVIDKICVFLNNQNVQFARSEMADLFNLVHRDLLVDINNYIKILPGIKSFLKLLKTRAVKIALITSDTHINSLEILDYLGINNIFDLVIGKDTFLYTKTSGISAVETCKLLGVQPRDAICIGDTQMDIIMSQKAGLMAGVGVVGQLTRDHLLSFTPYVINDFYELSIG